MSLVSRMSHGLRLPEKYIVAISLSASYRYKTYRIRKRREGYRTINHPSRELKALQRWLAVTEISRFPVHDSAMAYRPNKSIKDNALLHADCRYLLRLDFRSFFRSIRATDIESLLRDVCPAWSPTDYQHFLNLVCRYGTLTIGAPTSPSLSNAICHTMDGMIHHQMIVRDVTYSRYADDLFFSTDRPGVLCDVPQIVDVIIRDLQYPSSLTLNSTKTHHSSKKNRMQVTGLVLSNNGAVTIGRSKKREIRAKIHKYDRLDESGRRSLAGYLAYVNYVEPEFINSLILKYGKSRIDEVRTRPGSSVTGS